MEVEERTGKLSGHDGPLLDCTKKDMPEHDCVRFASGQEVRSNVAMAMWYPEILIMKSSRGVLCL